MTDPKSSAHTIDLELAQRLFQQGRVCMVSGEFQAAVQVFTDSIGVYPHFKALELLGECLLAIGEPIQAVVPLAAATALNDQVRAPSLLSQALLAIGDYERAARVATAVLARSPGNRVAQAVTANPFVARALADEGPVLPPLDD